MRFLSEIREVIYSLGLSSDKSCASKKKNKPDDKNAVSLEDKVKDIDFEAELNRIFNYFALTYNRKWDDYTDLPDWCPSVSRIKQAQLLKSTRTKIQTLILQGADINMYFNDNITLLLWAVEKCDAELALWLLERGADANLVNLTTGQSALYNAVTIYYSYSKRMRIIKALLQRGADINYIITKTGHLHGETVLSSSVRYLHDSPRRGLRIIKLLLDNGADASHINTSTGNTVLMTAARGSYCHTYLYKIMKLLLEHGADVTAVNRRGQDIYHILSSTHSRGYYYPGVHAKERDLVELCRLCSEYKDINSIKPHPYEEMTILLK